MLRFFLIIFIFFQIGCNRPLEQPELEDPIYFDLQAEKASFSKAIKDTEKEIQTLSEELNLAVPQTGQTKEAQKKIDRAQRALEHFKQMEKYYDLRIQSRITQARDEYLKSYHEKKPWPDPKNIEQYKKNKVLRKASRNWNERVPKPNFAVKHDQESQKKQSPPEEGGH